MSDADIAKVRAARAIGKQDILSIPPVHANQRKLFALMKQAPRRGSSELGSLKRSMFKPGRASNPCYNCVINLFSHTYAMYA